MTPTELASLEALAKWLRLRGDPDSSIDYAARSSGEGGVRGAIARVAVYGHDATFIAEHFHGQGARELAAAILSLIEEYKRMREALRYARPLLVKYAYTQGNDADFVRGITAPVDAALEPQS